MFDFLKRKRPQEAQPSLLEAVSVSPNSAQQRSNLHRELIRVVLKDTLRLHGIPLGWLACEVMTITRSSGAVELHIQLMVMQWNDKLLRYAPALQQQLLSGLDRFNPQVDHSKYIVSWRFSPLCGNPFVQMPDPKFWQPNTQPQAHDEPIPILDRRRTPRQPKARMLESSLFDTYERSSNFQPTDVIPLR